MHLIHNEKAKLRAAFLNNMSVGLILGGCALPYLALATNMPHVITGKDIFSLVSILVASVAALLLRRQAHRELDKLIDA